MSGSLLCLLLSISPALGEAKKHLEAGKIDDVFLALENQKLAPEDKAPAAELLARASVAALEKKDAVMALSLAELALKQNKEHPAGLEAASRASRVLEQFEQAEKHADRWIKADPKSGEARVLRAELALEAADWQVAIDQLSSVKAPGPLAEKVKALKARAQSELNDRKVAVTTVTNLEKTLRAAAAEARQRERSGETAAPSRSAEVVVYSTAWCGYCRKAKAWLTKKGIAFIEKDIEKDPGAAAELASKAAAAGIQPSGVPIIDARGTLVIGFDEPKLEQLL